MDAGDWFAVASFPVPRRSATLDWIRASVPPPPDYTGTNEEAGYCRIGGMTMPTRGARDWYEIDFDGRSGWYRSTCGSVDAVVFVGGRAYLMTAFTGRRPDGDIGQLRIWVQRVEFLPKDAVD